MKDNIVAALSIVLVGVIFVAIGFALGRNLQDPMKERQLGAWQQIYESGFTAGEREGFDKGYINCWNGLGMNWVGSYDRFRGFIGKYGSIHETPWNEFTIEEKVTIAMYGGSGSKLEKEEVEEWSNKYGIKKEVVTAYENRPK